LAFNVNARAMALTIEKAKTAHVAACTVFRQSHVGRLAAYPLMAINEGMIGLAPPIPAARENRRAVRGREARSGTKSDLDRRALGLDAPFLSRYGDLGVAAARLRSRCRARGNPDWLDRRCRGAPHHRTRQYPQGRALLPARRHRGYKAVGWRDVEVLCDLLPTFCVERPAGTMRPRIDDPASRDFLVARHRERNLPAATAEVAISR